MIAKKPTPANVARVLVRGGKDFGKMGKTEAHYYFSDNYIEVRAPRGRGRV